jgi:hypothetical protein
MLENQNSLLPRLLVCCLPAAHAGKPGDAAIICMPDISFIHA